LRSKKVNSTYHRARRPRLVAGALSLVALGAVFLAPASSSASITFGSDLKTQAQGFSDTCILSTPPCTQLLVGVRGANAFPAVSPADGVVVSFGIKSAAADTVTFRLARLSGNSSATGAGTGPTVTLPNPGKHSFPAHVRVKAGDYVGVDTSSVAAYSTACQTGGSEITYYPTLVDGGPFTPADANSTCEFLVNATVRPSSRFTFEKVKRDEDRGTATLRIDLPGPGRLALSGEGIKRVSEEAAAAGTEKLRIRPKRKVKRRLRNRGRAKVTAEVTFKPDGGSPSTKTKRVKLIRR
jgi:hypothetical protein